MSRRRRSREVAIKVLYQVDLVGNEADDALRQVVAEEVLRSVLESTTRDFARRYNNDPDACASFSHTCTEAVLAAWPGTASSVVPVLREAGIGVGLPTDQDESVHQLAKQCDDKVDGARKMVEFAADLVRVTIEHREEIDKLLGRFADNWTVDRMAALDRSILRLAACELLHFPDIPANVSINEAVDLAKKYSTAKSSEFVNGVLDRIRRDVNPTKNDPRAARDTTGTDKEEPPSQQPS